MLLRLSKTNKSLNSQENICENFINVFNEYINMKNNKYFFGNKPYLYLIPKDEFLDINEYKDYLLAKCLINEEHR